MRRLLPCVACCSLLPFCVGCCSVLPLCVAWSSALAARLVASRWSSAATPLPAAALSRRPCQQQLCQGAPCQQHLPDGSSLQRPCQPLRRSAPASNKPHPAEKSTPVWLAIWRTWAGFANSQLLPDAAAGAPSRALGAESSAERQLFRWKHLSAR